MGADAGADRQLRRPLGGSIGGHSWRLQGRTGRLEPVRVFGERHPVIVLDPSAWPDPWVTTRTVYRDVVGNDAVTEIAAFARDAVEFRVPPGSLYPVAQAPCHAVTTIVGVRPTSLSEATPLLRSIEDALHADWIAGAFARLTGGTTFVDLRLLTLPVDDPALDLNCARRVAQIIHEGGHIFGQHHPHHRPHGDGSVDSNRSFSSVWSRHAS